MACQVDFEQVKADFVRNLTLARKDISEKLENIFIALPEGPTADQQVGAWEILDGTIRNCLKPVEHLINQAMTDASIFPQWMWKMNELTSKRENGRTAIYVIDSLLAVLYNETQPVSSTSNSLETKPLKNTSETIARKENLQSRKKKKLHKQEG